MTTLLYGASCLPWQLSYVNMSSISAVAAGMDAEGWETAGRLAEKIALVNPYMTPAQCVSLVRGVVGSKERVTKWRRGDNAVERADLPRGTPLATFQDRDHRPSTTYDASGDHPGERRVGCPGNYSTHAVILESYVKDADGVVSGIRVWEQHMRSGPRLKDYNVGAGDLGGGYLTTRDALSYFVIMVEKDDISCPLGMDNPLNQFKTSKGAFKTLESFSMVAVIDQPTRSFRNTGILYLKGIADEGATHKYSFVTGGKGNGSAPFGVYNLDPKMIAGGKLKNRWRIYQENVGRDHAYDPGILGCTCPSFRSALRIHQAIADETEGCIGIIGNDDVFVNFEQSLNKLLERKVTPDFLLKRKC